MNGLMAKGQGRLEWDEPIKEAVPTCKRLYLPVRSSFQRASDGRHRVDALDFARELYRAHHYRCQEISASRRAAQKIAMTASPATTSLVSTIVNPLFDGSSVYRPLAA